jgi:hypothetical protein
VGAFVLETGAGIWILNDIGISQFPLFAVWDIPVFLWVAFDFTYKKLSPTYSGLQGEKPCTCRCAFAYYSVSSLHSGDTSIGDTEYNCPVVAISVF